MVPHLAISALLRSFFLVPFLELNLFAEVKWLAK